MSTYRFKVGDLVKADGEPRNHLPRVICKIIDLDNGKKAYTLFYLSTSCYYTFDVDQMGIFIRYGK